MTHDELDFIEKMERKHECVIFPDFINERLVPGMKILIKKMNHSRYSTKQDIYMECILTLKSRVRWNDGSCSDRWWTAEEGNSKWDIDEFYVTAPVAERNNPIYRKLAEPLNPPESPDFSSYRMLEQLLLWR